MQSGKPPLQSRDDVFESLEVDAARGTLREALSALRNFAELLHSLRVGSKALIAVLPDVAAGSGPMRSAVQRLLAVVAARAGMTGAADALEAYFAPRLRELDLALTQASLRPLSAKSRLALEQLVTRSSLELDTARGLLDLLVEALSGRTLAVDLAELVQQSFAGSPSVGSWHRPKLVATLSVVQADIEVELNPRVATALVALGVELVARSGRGTPHVLVDRDGEGRYRVNIEPSTQTGDDLVLIARGVIEPTLPCLRAVASVCGVLFAWNEAIPSLQCAFPERSRAATDGSPT